MVSAWELATDDEASGGGKKRCGKVQLQSAAFASARDLVLDAAPRELRVQVCGSYSE